MLIPISFLSYGLEGVGRERLGHACWQGMAAQRAYKIRLLTLHIIGALSRAPQSEHCACEVH
eukprot:4701179-Amphidinium_carterae.1